MTEKTTAVDYSLEIQVFFIVFLIVFFIGCPDLHDALLSHVLGDEYVAECEAEAGE